ncbi:MAG: 2-isopropylmalate synthase [Deltaproteobacteria bacterium]|nr:2-isopropylmalate synthase [Deltaproteobacteria bacterium]
MPSSHDRSRVPSNAAAPSPSPSTPGARSAHPEVPPQIEAAVRSPLGSEDSASLRAALARRIAIFDTTLRDGEQSAGVCFSAHDKAEIALLLDALGVDVIEAGFPVSSPEEAAAVAAVALEVRDASVCALARAVPRDVAAAGEALRHARAPRIHVFVNASDMQLAHQLGKSREQVVAMAAAMVRSAREFTDDVEFSPMDATRAEPEFLAELARAVLAAGARTLNLPDTVGCATPEQVAEMIRGVRARVPELERATISFHGQDDLGLATANSLAAIAAGAGQVECTINGIGERAGNTSLEEVAAALRVHGARLGMTTALKLDTLYALSRIVAERSGIEVPANKAVVGRNAFRHASGIHQDGVLKHRETYETLDPAWIGHPVGSEIVLGKLSGRARFAARVAALGEVLSEAQCERAFRAFQQLAARSREVSDVQLREIVARSAA